MIDARNEREREKVSRWYAEQMEASGMDRETAERKPFAHKLTAYALMFAVPVAMTGCSASDEPTGYEEYEWEMERTGMELECDDDSSVWYANHGYASKKAKAKANTSFYKSRSGIGSSGGWSSSGG